MEKKEQLTSVKLDSELFDLFKVACIKNKFSFKKLAERAIDLYLKDEDFKKQIHSHKL